MRHAVPVTNSRLQANPRHEDLGNIAWAYSKWIVIHECIRKHLLFYGEHSTAQECPLCGTVQCVACGLLCRYGSSMTAGQPRFMIKQRPDGRGKRKTPRSVVFVADVASWLEQMLLAPASVASMENQLQRERSKAQQDSKGDPGHRIIRDYVDGDLYRNRVKPGRRRGTHEIGISVTADGTVLSTRPIALVLLTVPPQGFQLTQKVVHAECKRTVVDIDLSGHTKRSLECIVLHNKSLCQEDRRKPSWTCVAAIGASFSA